jgi:hypothetical protein
MSGSFASLIIGLTLLGFDNTDAYICVWALGALYINGISALRQAPVSLVLTDLGRKHLCMGFEASHRHSNHGMRGLSPLRIIRGLCC